MAVPGNVLSKSKLNESPRDTRNSDDEKDTISQGKTSIGSAALRKAKSKTVDPRQSTLKKRSESTMERNVLDFNDRMYTVEVRPKDDEDESFEERLLELRVEVAKREV